MRQNKDVRGFVSRDEAWHQPPDWDIEVIRGNLLSAEHVRTLMAGVTGVIHAEHRITLGPGMSEHDLFYYNVQSTFNLVQEAARRIDHIERFVLRSSSSVYPSDTQILDVLYHPVDERHPCRPLGGYALSKKVSEDIVVALGRESGLQYTIVKPEVGSDTDLNGTLPD